MNVRERIKNVPKNTVVNVIVFNEREDRFVLKWYGMVNEIPGDVLSIDIERTLTHDRELYVYIKEQSWVNLQG